MHMLKQPYDALQIEKINNQKEWMKVANLHTNG